jgi:hypothetical protein
MVVDREKLYTAIAGAILPYTEETAPEDADGDPLNDPFVIETATFLVEEIIYSGIDITDEQAELDGEELENLPITQILTPRLNELLSPKDPLQIISAIIQLYTSPDPSPERRQHLRNGPCEVSSTHQGDVDFSYVIESCH